jgi:hypothetical protein
MGPETRALTLAALAGVLVAPGAPAAAASACGEALGAAAQRVSGARYEIAFRPVPAPIAPGTHFSLDVVVCGRPGAAPPAGLRVDALMPEHRHGMNYRPSITAEGTGRYRADGLMFHMPGRWDVVFEIATGEGTERLVATVELE